MSRERKAPVLAGRKRPAAASSAPRPPGGGSSGAGRRGPTEPEAGRGSNELAIGWREFRTKVAAYWLLFVKARREAPAGATLAERVAEVYRRERTAELRTPSVAAFRIERLCFDHVLRLWPARRDAPPPHHLLDGEAARELPEESLIMLHAGLGMALAERLLRGLGAASGAAAFDLALRRFLFLVRLNSRPEYADVPIEALGLMVRMFRARIHRAVERQLAAIDPGLGGLYWHGAGRAIYFLPAQFHPFPAGLDRGLGLCRREPSEPAHRLDALSGFSFAAAMMGLGHPRSLEPLLARLGARPERPEEAEALASGVATAIVTRYHTTPYDPAIASFLAYRPAASDAPGERRRELWQRCVAAPCALALEHLYPALKAAGRLGLLGRHQRLSALAGGAGS